MEAWMLQLAAHVGLQASSCELITFGTRQALMVERFDRLNGQRLHQEDFCQILGLGPADKYEPGGASGPSRLSKIVSMAANFAVDPTAFRIKLLEQVAFNVMIGNADAHSKNYSVLIDSQATLRLAPLYDTAPLHYMARRFDSIGHTINGKTRLTWVRPADLISEAEVWGISRDMAIKTLASLAERLTTSLQVLPSPTESSEISREIIETAQTFISADVTPSR